jgi:hypothetical protein
LKLSACVKCTHHVEAMTDSVLCKYYKETEYRVLDKSDKKGEIKVVSCPIELSK